MIQITYQKENGSIFQRIRKTDLPYKIGDTTSMGWKVLNIEYGYNNKYYPSYEYYSLIHKSINRHRKKKRIKEIFIEKTITLLNYIIWFIVIDIVRISI